MLFAIHVKDGKKYKLQPTNIEIGCVVCGFDFVECVLTARQILQDFEPLNVVSFGQINENNTFEVLLNTQVKK